MLIIVFVGVQEAYWSSIFIRASTLTFTEHFISQNILKLRGLPELVYDLNVPENVSKFAARCE